jgi:hypothetical protein
MLLDLSEFETLCIRQHPKIVAKPEANDYAAHWRRQTGLRSAFPAVEFDVHHLVFPYEWLHLVFLAVVLSK